LPWHTSLTARGSEVIVGAEWVALRPRPSVTSHAHEAHVLKLQLRQQALNG